MAAAQLLQFAFDMRLWHVLAAHLLLCCSKNSRGYAHLLLLQQRGGRSCKSDMPETLVKGFLSKACQRLSSQALVKETGTEPCRSTAAASAASDRLMQSVCVMHLMCSMTATPHNIEPKKQHLAVWMPLQQQPWLSIKLLTVVLRSCRP